MGLNKAAYLAVRWYVAILGSPAFLPEVLTRCQTDRMKKKRVTYKRRS